VSDNIELGASYRKGGWSAGAAAYYLRTKDEIFFNGFPVNLNENLSETRRVGAQAGAGYNTKRAGIRSQVDYVDATLREDDGTVRTGPLRMVPEWRVTNTLTLRPADGWEARVTHRHIGSSFVDDSYTGTSPDKVAGVDLFDLKLSFRPAADWRVFAGVNNVFDRAYVSYAASQFGFESYYAGPGRFVYGGLNVSF